MQAESGELTRAFTAYLIALAFAATFLLTIALGGGLSSALTRGIIVAIATRLVGPHLVRPLLTSILDAIARDQEERGAVNDAEGAEDSP